MKYTLILIILFFPFIGECACPTCPGDVGHIERLLQNITSAIKSESENIVLGRKLSSTELFKLISNGLFINENTQDLLKSGRVIQAFEVMDSLRRSKKTLVYFTPIKMETPTSGGSGTSFFPADGSIWLFIYSLQENLENSDAERIELPHGYDGAIADTPNNGLGINLKQLLNDLKKVEVATKTGLTGESRKEIQNGFAVEVFKRLSAEKLTK